MRSLWGWNIGGDGIDRSILVHQDRGLQERACVALGGSSSGSVWLLLFLGLCVLAKQDSRTVQFALEFKLSLCCRQYSVHLKPVGCMEKNTRCFFTRLVLVLIRLRFCGHNSPSFPTSHVYRYQYQYVYSLQVNVISKLCSCMYCFGTKSTATTDYKQTQVLVVPLLLDCVRTRLLVLYFICDCSGRPNIQSQFAVS